MMYPNGSVTNNVRYLDICTEKFVINVAYNNDPFRSFKIANNSLVPFKPKYNGNRVGIVSNIPYDFQILSKLFENNNIIVNWINCNYTWGSIDQETGNWSGLVGQVSISNMIIMINYQNIYFLDSK